MKPLPYDRPECCQKYLPPLPKDVACFCRELSEELKALQRRHRRMFVKRPRIMEMARPVFRREKTVYKCPCLTKREIEIVRLEKPRRTRTDQLALPSVWKLLEFKKRVKNTYPATRMYSLNRLIRASLLSLYSYLHNIQPPQEPIPKKKWTKKEWKEHSKNFERLAMPNPEPELPKIRRKAKPLSEMKRFKRLAQPKCYPSEVPSSWKLTPAIKYYKPSDRIKEMAVPKKYDFSILHQELPIHPPESALKYKATDRIKEMALPMIKKSGGENDRRENPFAISPNALKYKPSTRMQELAEPKEYENVHIRENPQYISPAALKAKATPRIIELAKPKGS